VCGRGARGGGGAARALLRRTHGARRALRPGPLRPRGPLGLALPLSDAQPGETVSLQYDRRYLVGFTKAKVQTGKYGREVSEKNNNHEKGYLINSGSRQRTVFRTS
jgi:hypothetical protein